jgi:hypothetical protein
MLPLPCVWDYLTALLLHELLLLLLGWSWEW